MRVRSEVLRMSCVDDDSGARSPGQRRRGLRSTRCIRCRRVWRYPVFVQARKRGLQQVKTPPLRDNRARGANEPATRGPYCCRRPDNVATPTARPWHHSGTCPSAAAAPLIKELGAVDLCTGSRCVELILRAWAFKARQPRWSSLVESGGDNIDNVGPR